MNVDLRELAIDRQESSQKSRGSPRRILTRYVLPGVLLAGFLLLVAFAAWDHIFPARPVKVIPVLATHAASQPAGTPLFKAAGWVQPRPTAVRVAALAPGVVEQLLVVEDQLVEQGEVIARLVDEDARLALQHAVVERNLRAAELEQAEATLRAATTRLDQPVHLEAKLAEADAALADVQTSLETLPFETQAAEARQRLARQELEGKRRASSVVPGREIDQAESELDSANALVEKLQQRVTALRNQKKALQSRRNALSQQLQLKADELQAKEEATANVKAAEARLEHAGVAESVAQLRLDRMSVKAPVNGRVLHLVAQPGTRLVSGGGMADSDGSTVVTMYRPDQLQVRVDVRFEDLPRIQLNQPVSIESPAVADPVKGEVLLISSLADIQKNTLEVKVAIKDPPPVFKPEMLVDVTFLAPPSKADASATTERLRLYVPKQLVESEDGGRFVWVADQDAGVARRTAVEVGAEGDNGLVEITSGLTIASRLIAEGKDGLGDGDRIQVTGEVGE